VDETILTARAVYYFGEIGNFGPEDEKGSLRTAFGQGLLGPKFLVKPLIVVSSTK
jgi:hypothetical protein